MSNDEYWDESEFGFFETLEDEDKLLYLYDLMIGDFVHEYVGSDIEDVFEIEFEEEPVEPMHQNVTVSFGWFVKDGYKKLISLYFLKSSTAPFNDSKKDFPKV